MCGDPAVLAVIHGTACAWHHDRHDGTPCFRIGHAWVELREGYGKVAAYDETFDFTVPRSGGRGGPRALQCLAIGVS